MKRNLKKIYAIMAAGFIGAATLTACGGSEKPVISVEWPAMDTLESIEVSDIESVAYVRSTEAGAKTDTVTDATQIEDIYLRLKEVEATEETEEAVEDDGLGITIKAGNKTVSFSFEGDILVEESGKRYKVNNLTPLKKYIDGLSAGDTTVATTTASTTTATTAATTAATIAATTQASGVYDIKKGMETKTSSDGSIAYLYFNDFMIVMPNNDKYSFDASGDSVTFYLWAAQQEGYGGELVTIKAYDINDDSYKNLPSYSDAGIGQNVNKRFIAIFPTDAPWNTNDATQTADYKDLSEYLHKIGAGAVNSPMVTSDSN